MTSSSPGGRRRLLLRLTAATLTYVALGLLGRWTMMSGEPLALVWPAAGGAVVLLGVLPRSWWWVGVAALSVATFGLNLVAGAPTDSAAAFVAPNLVQGLVGAVLLARVAPHLVLGGGRLALQTFRDYVALIAAAVASSAAAVTVGTGVMVALGLMSWSPLGAVSWAGRNIVGALVVLTVATLLLGRTSEREPTPRGGDETTGGRRAELVALALVTVALYGVVLSGVMGLPLAFPLLVPTVWAGLRFDLRVVTVHSLAVAVVVAVATLQSSGPFVVAAPGHPQALLTQGFMGMVLVVGILLALASDERRVLARTLRTAHDRARDQATILATVIDSMHEGVTLVDAEGEVLLRNPAGEEMLRRRLAGGGEVAVVDFCDAAGRVLPSEEWPVSRALRGENVTGAELTLRFGDDLPERDVSVSARRLPYPGAAGQPQVVTIYHDVTSERAHREALETFARTVAHDLKGPLTVVEGWGELLVADARELAAVPADAVAGPADRILRATASMRSLVSDLLEQSLSRDQRPRLAPLLLEELAQEVAREVGGSATRQPHIAVAALPPVMGDRVMLRQVLSNLFGNAVKFASDGEAARVTVSGRRVDGPAGPMVEVVVADRGVGIPDGEHERVFEEYGRARGSEGYEGHGLGLSTCRNLVRRHGGTITARPREDGAGTAFVLSLPAHAPRQGGPAGRLSPPVGLVVGGGG